MQCIANDVLLDLHQDPFRTHRAKMADGFAIDLVAQCVNRTANQETRQLNRATNEGRTVGKDSGETEGAFGSNVGCLDGRTVLQHG